MILGDRLRTLREAKSASLRDIAERTGLSEYFMQRVESGHAIPTIEVLEKWAEALSIPVHELFYEGNEPPPLQNLPDRLTAEQIAKVHLRDFLDLFGKQQ